MIRVAFATALLVMMALSTGWAQDKPDPNVEVRVLAILASESNKNVDKRLTNFASEVQKTAPHLTGFRIHHTVAESVPLGQTKKVDLNMLKLVVEVTPNLPKDENGRITLTVQPPGLTAMTYECVCGKYVVTATQQFKGEGKDREQLFIAIMASPCSGKKK